jgi:crotonobetainyl-CoA:carnitine CoA-transferase CaiB-like acyl-CoA transferase
VQPLAGLLVVELTRYLPGAYGGRGLLRLGGRVVRLEAPEGDPLRRAAPAWDDALAAGKESVTCDLKRERGLALALLSRADVVLEGFRPGVADRLGVGPASLPGSVVYCSITGFGHDALHAGRAGHDLNYLGWAGALDDTAPALPPVQAADLAAGSLAAVNEVLAALLARSRDGRGRHVVVSMTHGSHRLVAHRLGGEPVPRLLTGGLACYRIYRTADGRWLTVAALEPVFFERLCAVIGRPELAERQYEPGGQEELALELAAVLARRTLADWLAAFDGEDACVGPVATLEEADAAFGDPPSGAVAPALGEHTESWRRDLGLWGRRRSSSCWARCCAQGQPGRARRRPSQCGAATSTSATGG